MLRLNWLRLLLIPASLILLPAWIWADISLPKIFSDHMVLQQQCSTPIWGTAEPNQKLIVAFNDNETSIQADPEGRWSTLIKTPAAGGPFQLTIRAEAGEPKVVFSDVMVGEVWICSGQSNMAFPMDRVLNAENEIKLAKNFPNLRLFTVANSASPQPLDDFANVTPWSVCAPDSVKSFSGVAYFFGRELSKELGDVPIGLINSSWDGTRCEAWIARSAMDEIESLAPLLRHWNENDDPTSQDRPANLFNAMIAPMHKFKIRGVIWYQGESNNGRGDQYATLFPTLIKNWRHEFQAGKLPFLFVQLAPFRYKDNLPTDLPEIWDAQLRTFKSVPDTGMVVTTDIGDVADINPKNKQAVGRRLAILALATAYRDQLTAEQRPSVYSGPIYESMSINGNRIRLTFQHTGQGLRKRNPDQPLAHFMVCGEDRRFVPANATIEGDTVVVSSPDVSHPTEVRFGWTDTAEPNLCNSEGFPASPFRTDDFPLESAGKSF